MSEITRDDIMREVRRRRAVLGVETVEQVSQRIRIDYADGWFDMHEISTDGLLALLVTELQTSTILAPSLTMHPAEMLERAKGIFPWVFSRLPQELVMHPISERAFGPLPTGTKHPIGKDGNDG